jgi:hypothetical protein
MFSAVAFADWPQYQGNGEHNGRITSGTPPITMPNAPYVTPGGGISSESVMSIENFREEETYTYAYTLTSGGTLAKTNVMRPGEGEEAGEWSITFPNSASYQLGSPCLIPAGVPYEGIYATVSSYHELLLNPQFEYDYSWWSASSPETTWDPDNHVYLPEGESILQPFTFTGADGSYFTELFSQVKQRQFPNTEVTYVISDNMGEPIITYVANPTSREEWTNVEQYNTVELEQYGSYMITVTATTGDAFLHHVDFSWQQSGLTRVSLDGETTTFIAASPGGGQANTPITNYGQYLYYGTLSGGANYFQIDLSDSSIKSYSSGTRQYWAGAAQISTEEGAYMVFGSDGGYLHLTPAGQYFGDPDPDISVSINLAEVITGLTAPGNVRSTVSVDGTNTYIYFTSQGGYLWQATIAELLDPTEDQTFSAIELGSPVSLPSATSTPALSRSGPLLTKYIYTGYYTGPNGAGGVAAATESDFDSPTPGPIPVSVLDTVYSGGAHEGAVQSSPIVYTNGSWDYIYFTTNTEEGIGYCYRFNGVTAQKRWAAGGASGNRYAVQGFSSESGYLVYGDDGGRLYIMH